MPVHPTRAQPYPQPQPVVAEDVSVLSCRLTPGVVQGLRVRSCPASERLCPVSPWFPTWGKAGHDPGLPAKVTMNGDATIQKLRKIESSPWQTKTRHRETGGVFGWSIVFGKGQLPVIAQIGQRSPVQPESGCLKGVSMNSRATSLAHCDCAMTPCPLEGNWT